MQKGHTDTNTVGNFHIRTRLYGVSRYTVFSYVWLWPTLRVVYMLNMQVILHVWHLSLHRCWRYAKDLLLNSHSMPNKSNSLGLLPVSRQGTKTHREVSKKWIKLISPGYKVAHSHGPCFGQGSLSRCTRGKRTACKDQGGNITVLQLVNRWGMCRHFGRA